MIGPTNGLPLEFDEQNIVVRASFGVTGIDLGKGVTPEMLYRMADKATYQAKALGGSTVCVNLTPIPTYEAGK